MDGLAFLEEYHRHSKKYLPLIDHADQIFPKRDPVYDDVNIGWNCGLIDTARPYFAECWAVDGITMLTIFISTDGIEDSPSEGVDAMCEAHKVYHKLYNSRSPSVVPFADSRGNHFFSVNVVVGDENSTYVDGTAKSYSFSILNEYNQKRAAVHNDKGGMKDEVLK